MVASTGETDRYLACTQLAQKKHYLIVNTIYYRVLNSVSLNYMVFENSFIVLNSIFYNIIDFKEISESLKMYAGRFE